MSCFECPNCGMVDDINIYNEKLRRPRFKIAPVIPTCKRCGSEVDCSANNEYKRRVVVLIGACGSGKTTIAEKLMLEHGYNAIDLDCMIDLLKHKYPDEKLEFNSPEGYCEIENCIKILKCFDKDIVLSLVVFLDELERYRNMFRRQNLDYQTYFLSTTLDTLMHRTKTRTCFDKPTPEEWVVHFYKELKPIEEMECDDIIVINNNDISVDETLNVILGTQ